MPNSSESIRFEVSVNGEVAGTGGVSGYGVLQTLLTWARRSPEAIPEQMRDDVDLEAWSAEHLALDLGGLDSLREENVRWLSSRPLEVGDEVTIRILPPGPIDDAERESRMERAAAGGG